MYGVSACIPPNGLELALSLVFGLCKLSRMICDMYIDCFYSTILFYVFVFRDRQNCILVIEPVSWCVGLQVAVPGVV